MNRICSLKSLALGVAALLIASPSVHALSIQFDFANNDTATQLPEVDLSLNWTKGGTVAQRTVNGITLEVTDGTGNANAVNQNTGQGLGATTSPISTGGGLEPGESLIFKFFDGATLVSGSLTSMVVRFATINESYKIDILSGGAGSVTSYFPAGTSSNNFEAIDLSSAGLFGSSFDIANSTPNNDWGNIRIASVTFDSVPDGGLTLVLLGLGVAGLAILRRKLT